MDLKPDDNDLQIAIVEDADQQINLTSIFDISKIIQRLDLDEIKYLTLKTLNSNTNICKDEINDFNIEIKSSLKEVNF